MLDRPDALNRIHALTPMARLATPEEVANAILFQQQLRRGDGD